MEGGQSFKGKDCSEGIEGAEVREEGGLRWREEQVSGEEEKKIRD